MQAALVAVLVTIPLGSQAFFSHLPPAVCAK
jgi:hypothetical protein